MTGIRTIAQAESAIRLLEAENERLRRQIVKHQQVTRNVLSAVADFGAAAAMDQVTGFGPGQPDAVHALVETLVHWREENTRPVLIGPVPYREAS